MFKHLMVPLDGSDLAESALPMVQTIAERFASEITLFRAVQIPLLIGDSYDFAELHTTFSHEMQQEAEVYLMAKQEALQGAGFTVNCRIVTGESAADAILIAADELAVDTIVMSTHGRGGLARWVFGSVADKVLRHARVPILLARAKISTRV
jgi:nucleotide-binding universal stress UspA family protein